MHQHHGAERLRLPLQPEVDKQSDHEQGEEGATQDRQDEQTGITEALARIETELIVHSAAPSTRQGRASQEWDLSTTERASHP